MSDAAIHHDFFTPHYQAHNAATLGHLATLGFDFRGKRVLEVGSGPGDHTAFYLARGAIVLPTDGRREIVDHVNRRYGPRIEQAEVVDLDAEPEKLLALPIALPIALPNALPNALPSATVAKTKSPYGFDFLHSYGILYHLADPARFIQVASEVAETILLNTCCSFGADEALNPVTEDVRVLSQALHHGCRPTRPWIMTELKKHYPHAYAVRTQPDHPEFPRDWRGTQPPGLVRAVFVASHRELPSPLFVAELPAVYDA